MAHYNVFICFYFSFSIFFYLNLVETAYNISYDFLVFD